MAEEVDQETRAELEKIQLNGVTVTKNELGRGSYAVVLELEYRGLKCAGKELHTSLHESGTGYATKRFLEECRLLSNTKHPNIVQFIGIYFKKHSEFPILVMEFLPTNLTNCLKRYGVLPNEISYSVLHDVSLGLAYLHGQRPPIVHRDLSGNNILLDPNMVAKISDLGVAKILNMDPLQMHTKAPGTQIFMPPEAMVDNPNYGVAVDEFSYGVLMLQVFTAQWPKLELGPTKIDPKNPKNLIAISEEERRADYINMIPDHPVLDLILRCLSNNPEFRPNVTEIVGRMKIMTSQHPPSFENKVDMLRRISAQDKRTRELESDVQTVSTELQEKKSECEAIRLELQEEIEQLNTKLQRIKSHLTVKSQDTLELRQIADCPVCTQYGQAIVIEGTLFYGGGSNDDCRVHFYAPTSNTWTRLRSHKLTRFGLGQMNGKLITVGGYDAKHRVSSTIQSIEMLYKKWKVYDRQMPTARCYPTVISHSAYIIVAGGVVSVTPTTQYTNALEIYNIETAQWGRAKELPVGGVFINGGIQDDHVYMIGGVNETGERNSVYTTTMDKLLASQEPLSLEAIADNETLWKKMAHTELFAPSAFISSNMNLAMGGHTISGKCSGGIYMYTHTLNSWSYVGNLPIPLSKPAIAPSSASECYIVGGKDYKGQQLNTAYKCKFNITVLK